MSEDTYAFFVLQGLFHRVLVKQTLSSVSLRDAELLTLYESPAPWIVARCQLLDALQHGRLWRTLI